MVGLFDILGPVMVGPSSSHTAGACRLGLMARAILGRTPAHARIQLHGSFAATGEGHGTQRAIIGGLLGVPPDDLRLRTAFEEADAAGLRYTFETVDLGDDAHPNTAVFELEGDRAHATAGPGGDDPDDGDPGGSAPRGGDPRGGDPRGADASERVRVRGASVGGGRIVVTAIDEFPVDLGGDYHTLILVAQDQPGTIATISRIFAEDGVNLATMRVDRTGRHKEALMTLEVDAPISDPVLDEIRAFPWVAWARRIEQIA